MTDIYPIKLHANRKLIARIFSKVKVSTTLFYKGVPCWEWQASISKETGYAHISNGVNVNRIAHRFIYEHFIEKVPRELVCDHLCRVHHCVNPAHIEIVTQQVNVLRGNAISVKYANATHCINGHPFSGSNLVIRYEKRINTIQKRRECRICNNRRGREYRERKRQKTKLSKI